ncbi:OLC1v1017023C1 [Oldenlandia corymbosa var. corymbosa]|uniref:OLC1v1017023C1 n=1 Tax=Oldenlandia corymbosa var. corymbosa TaxID=529605 RepID=A0AAV1E8I6_OLDCO|nr:OLC1v1017023C1 [Oldenlandia corymbosa var. corymbosa]
MANNPQSSGAQPPRPHLMGAMPPQGYGAPYPMQFRPGMPGHQGQPFPPVSNAQQFRPAGAVQNVGMPNGQNQPQQFSQPMQQFPPRPGQPGNITPSSQPVSGTFIQSSMPLTSGTLQAQHMGPNHMSGLGGPGAPFSSSYTFTPSPFGQTQNGINVPSQYHNSSQVHAPLVSTGGQSWVHQGSQSAPTITHPQEATAQPSSSVSNPSDWQEFEAADGRRYYHNKVTKQSSWEKPVELMTPLERADASTVWKEFTTAEGRKYYYNKETKQSKWTIPEELKLAREQAEKAAQEGHLDVTAPAAATPSVEQQSPAVNSVISSMMIDVTSSPVPVTPIATSITSPAMAISGSPAVLTAQQTSAGSSVGETLALAATPKSLGVLLVENNVSHVMESSKAEASALDSEDVKKDTIVTRKADVATAEEKPSDDEPFLYASKQEAKIAFKALLESANVEADWTWEQAMRVIINDRRYGALKTLGERKQAFNEYLMQRKKIEAEERRLRQRKAKEEFTKMLEESEELTSSTRWSKAVTMFEDDERFKAVEREADREDLFRSYLVDLQKRERAKAQEEHRRNRLEYRQYLETCGFVKVDSQWRKVQDLLEDDERCSRLDKIDRLEIYQEYIRDLEREEEELKKVEREEMRRAERKNRDAFRNLLAEHVASGILTAKTNWRDYCQKVKDTSAYQDLALNTSGSRPKDLFEDVFEELENQYHEDKARVKDVVKAEKIIVNPTWSFEDFKAAIKDNIGSLGVSDINLQLAFQDLLERAKDKEEKEAKKRQRLAKDFTDLLSSFKEITTTSDWEEARELVEASSEYKSIGEESICKEIFEDYVTRLLEKSKDKERKREEEKSKKEKDREEKEKKKEKERREKEKEKDRDSEKEKEKGKERSKKDDADSSNMDDIDDQDHKEEKKREKDKERKHRRRHHDASDEAVKINLLKGSIVFVRNSDKDDKEKSRRHSSDHASSDKDEKEETKKSRRHGSDRKKSRKHGHHSPESDSESKHKKHKRDHRDGSRRSGGIDELEDGEVGEDGEIQ